MIPAGLHCKGANGRDASIELNGQVRAGSVREELLEQYAGGMIPQRNQLLVSYSPG